MRTTPIYCRHKWFREPARVNCLPLKLHLGWFLPARRYASAVLAMALCPSVRLSVSVTSRSSIETDGRIQLVLEWKLPSTHPTVC